MNWLKFNNIQIATHLIDNYHTMYFYTDDKAYYWNSIKESQWANYGFVERTGKDLSFQNKMSWYDRDTRYVIIK